MKIAVLGTRGFPNVQGGVEVHCENLYPRLVAAGCDVTILARAPYVGNTPYEFKGVKIVPIPCWKNKVFETITHTVLGVWRARLMHVDVLHIHAVGPNIFTPLARLLGLRVVMTHHGPDYERAKWGKAARLILMIGEMFGCLFANEVIVIAGHIASFIQLKYHRNSHIIPNGVDIPEYAQTDEILQKYGLEKNKYLLAVARFVPEKGLHDLIRAFSGIDAKGWKLVIAGDADHEDAYSIKLKKLAAQHANVVLTGFVSAQPLKELYSHAGVFVLPSYYEGLPIVLLEALSFGLPCVISDIAANRNVTLPDEWFFKPGDVKALSHKLDVAISSYRFDPRLTQVDMIRRNYNWDAIAHSTREVY